MTETNGYKILSLVNSSEDVKKLPMEKLTDLCDELRKFIIDAATSNPGHLAANLGVIELTVALHRVFQTPYDKIIFDVGHQAYSHKIITGRRDVFDTNRKFGGISGFPNRAESPYDAFGVGHSSTSISAALGMATADALKGETNRHIVAVIGDGSLSGGMAFEALNNAGASKANILVVLNDNKMAIDPNVGALSDYLLNITTSPTYNRLKDKTWNFLGNNFLRGAIQRIQAGIKATLIGKGNLFEDINFRYFGPVDGHGVKQLVRVMEDLKNIPGPKLLHVITTKGKGLPYSEHDPSRWHSPSAFNKETGEFIHTSTCISFSEIFGKTLVELATQNEKIVGITPAMSRGSGMHWMQKAFPDRTFDVGIAEQHAVTFSAGMAAEGMIPFCNIYSTFSQRAYDQIIHDVALQKLHVVLCLDRAGLVGPDGATHHGAFDMAALRCIPHMIIASPAHAEDLRNLMFTALAADAPFVIRYPKQSVATQQWQTSMHVLPVGKGRVIQEGTQVALVTLGSMADTAAKAAQVLFDDCKVKVGLYDMIFLKPLDEILLHQICTRYEQIVTLEEGVIQGGLGSAIMEFIQDHGYHTTVHRMGIPDRFMPHGTIEELYRECHCDVAGIQQTVQNLLAL